MSNVLISHSSQDKPFVKRLASALLSEGVPVWLDSWKLELGDSLFDKVYDGIDSSSIVILVVSQHAIESGWVNREMNAALSKEDQTGRKFLIPIKIDNCQLPIKIADRLYSDFSTSFSAPFGKLIDVLESRGCQELPVAPDREQICLSFTREVNLDRDSLRKAIEHLQRRQGTLKVNPAQLVVNEDKDAEILLDRLHSRIDNIATDEFYSADFETSLRGMLSEVSRNSRWLSEGVSLLLANHPSLESIYWFARILRAKNAYILYNVQNPRSDIIQYGKEWFSASLDSNQDAARFFGVESVSSIDFWRRGNESRSPYFHVWVDRKDTETLRSYMGAPGDFGDLSPGATDKFVYPQMVFQHLRDKAKPIIWALNDALVGLS